MKLAVFSLVLLTMIGSSSAQKSSRKKPANTATAKSLDLPEAYRTLLSGSQQMIVVTTPTWSAIDGSLQRYEKTGDTWQPVGDKVAIVVGKNGLAWDGAIDLPFKTTDPVKKEGDGRSPAGVFPISELFGFDASSTDAKLPYRALTDSIECVDDASSMFYNKVVNRSEVPTPEWSSSEKMRSVPVYKEGAVVSYNADSLPGAGSCIFLHIWNGAGHGTAGCTAMDEAKLQGVLQWLDGAKNPVLVQFPAPIYTRIRANWRLPI